MTQAIDFARPTWTRMQAFVTMSERPPARSPLPASVNQPSLQRNADAQAFLDAALDRILRAWADGEDFGVEVLARERPELRDELVALVDLAREAALLRPQVLPQVPGYDVLREIGRGGMGVVYAARHKSLERVVALKVLPDAVAGSDRARRRFLAEARSLAKLRHPHVVTIFDVVDAGEVCAYAMEWIDGKSLADLLEDLADWSRRGPAPEVAFGDEHSARLPRDAWCGSAGWASRSHVPWVKCTAAVWCTATSSRATSCCAPMARRCCRTSAWCATSTRA